MPYDNVCLGLCFFDQQLFYAVSAPEQRSYLRRIGAIDFNFNIGEALFSVAEEKIAGIRSSIDDLINRFGIQQLQILVYPHLECWATLPKLVYDNADERESYINILMNGVERKHIRPAWYELSNQNFKLLQLRTDHGMKGLEKLTGGLAEVGFSSAFEMDERWIQHAKPGGSILTICGFSNCIAICSFILGKLRGVTYITFDDAEDLPYLWLQKSQDLPWMQGLHEHIHVCGRRAQKIIEILQPFLDDAGVITKMDSLEKIQVRADERTYGFDLSLAFPAIMLALR
ncbi:MAG TPA: hypothetical protein VE868_02325 [Balneolaceae bacterium]|nr:hypothetical protein [Balneolaceae bacterium]